MFEASAPKVDQVIEVTAELNQTQNVQFRMVNLSPKYSSFFLAEFNHESASELSVFPKEGKLEPSSRDGTMFTVAYTPVEYGKIKNGLLIIQTNEMYWSFLVKGTFPQYQPPTYIKSSLDNWLNKETLKKLKHN